MCKPTIAIAVMTCLLTWSPPRAQAQPTDASRTYRLSRSSIFQEGCFEPCLCPLFGEAHVFGVFTLTPVNDDSPARDFTVSNLHWVIPYGDVARTVTGPGTYHLEQHDEGSFHRLSLDLSVEGVGQEHFDSGLVATNAEFPKIDITISVNGIFCYDYVFTLATRPQRFGDVNHDDAVNVFDILCVLDGFTDHFDNCPAQDVDITPCSGDGAVNIYDVLAVLDAFADTDADPCMP